MKKIAVIDIGSNSVRLMLMADGKVLYKRLNSTRLGEGLSACSRLTAAAIQRSAQAVAEFSLQAKAEGATQVYAFATAAVRSAENAKEFLHLVHSLCGICVEVVSGEREAELGLLGALGNADGAVLDMGGASTELVVKEKGKIIYKKSVDIGVVRLKESCGQDQAALRRAAIAAAQAYANVPKLSCVYAIGGTATTLAALALGLTEYSFDKVTGTRITAEDMQAWADKLLGMQPSEIAALPCMPPGRADVLAGGAQALATIMQQLNVAEIIVSDRDNLEGYAIQKGLLL